MRHADTFCAVPARATLPERLGRRAWIAGIGWAQRARVRHFRRLSTNRSAFVGADVHTAVLAVGPGSIDMRGVQLGYWPSPGALTTCIHLDTRVWQLRASASAPVRS